MAALVVGGVTSCEEWNDTASVETKVTKPWEQDPALWARYTAALRDYKASGEHFIAYARLHNSPEKAASEKDFMRCLPDSLDIVSLTNADNFSAFDTEDMAVMREKGTRVLYQVDYAGRKAEFSDAAKLAAYLDKVVAAVAANGLNGYSFTVINDDTAAAQIVARLSADEGKLLVFEGNPLFVPAADRAKVDYFVLDTDDTTNATDLKLQVLGATGYAAVPAEKLLLAAASSMSIQDEERVEHAAIDEMSRRVISLGPLAGLAVYNLADDYYHAEMNYAATRRAIQTLNPSK
jgi:hypothetical protein